MKSGCRSREKTSDPDARKTLGRRGEELAALFLMHRGFRLVQKNWRCRSGEIDLIMERDGVIHFVEVKTRAGTQFGYPEEAITWAKQRHLARSVETWLRARGSEDQPYQVDALLILFERNTKPDIRFLEHILL